MSAAFSNVPFTTAVGSPATAPTSPSTQSDLSVPDSKPFQEFLDEASRDDLSALPSVDLTETLVQPATEVESLELNALTFTSIDIGDVTRTETVDTQQRYETPLVDDTNRLAVTNQLNSQVDATGLPAKAVDTSSAQALGLNATSEQQASASVDARVSTSPESALRNQAANTGDQIPAELGSDGKDQPLASNPRSDATGEIAAKNTAAPSGEVNGNSDVSTLANPLTVNFADQVITPQESSETLPTSVVSSDNIESTSASTERLPRESGSPAEPKSDLPQANEPQLPEAPVVNEDSSGDVAELGNPVAVARSLSASQPTTSQPAAVAETIAADPRPTDANSQLNDGEVASTSDATDQFGQFDESSKNQDDDRPRPGVDQDTLRGSVSENAFRSAEQSETALDIQRNVPASLDSPGAPANQTVSGTESPQVVEPVTSQTIVPAESAPPADSVLNVAADPVTFSRVESPLRAAGSVLTAQSIASFQSTDATQQTAAAVAHVIESVDGETKTMSFDLNPADLGRLAIQVTQSGEAVAAQIIASELLSSEMLNTQKEALQDALGNLGFGDVSVDISHQQDSESQTSSDSSTPHFSFGATDTNQNQTQDQRSTISTSGLNIVA